MSKVITCALVSLVVFLFFTRSHKASAPSYAENSALNLGSYAAAADCEGSDEEDDHDEYSFDSYGSLKLDIDGAERSNFAGTTTIDVYNPRSGNSYSLEADVNDGQVERIYFPNGGWSDMSSSDVSFGSGSGTDIEGREWEFDGVPEE